MAFVRVRRPQLHGDISSISPSFAAQLEVCPLAAIFSKDEAFRNLARRGSHFAALGEICHTLWEREGRGEFDSLSDDSLKAALNEAWDEAEAASVRELSESLGGVLPPEPHQWPGYLAKRLGVLALIKRSIQQRRENSGPAAGGFRPSVEEPIEAAGVRLRGRPDRVVWRHGSAHIIDLKTCAPGDAMSPTHRRQLLAYAYLFHAKSGTWPDTASIQYVGGETRTFDVNPAEAEKVVAEMLAALDEVNGFRGDSERLARPSATACRWCEFKVACAPFYSTVDAGWGLSDRHVLGVVVEMEPAGGRASITLRLIYGDLVVQSVVVVAPDARLFDGINVGDYVAIAGATATRSPTTIRCDWDSVACVWQHGAGPDPSVSLVRTRDTSTGDNGSS
jgi:RecB family exonuclease